jgi:hypothetical protein
MRQSAGILARLISEFALQSADLSAKRQARLSTKPGSAEKNLNTKIAKARSEDLASSFLKFQRATVPAF